MNDGVGARTAGAIPPGVLASINGNVEGDVMRKIDLTDEYTLDDQGRIRPVHQVRMVREHWDNAATFEEALAGVAAVAMGDVFPPDSRSIGPEELGDLQAKRYLDLADAFYLATGVDARFGVYRFSWQGETFFTMRPDFFLKSLASDLNELPVNAFESAILDRLILYHRLTEALKHAQLHGELNASDVHPIEWWIDFWLVRGIGVPGFDCGSGQGAAEKELKTTERNSLLLIIAALCHYSDIDPQGRGTASQIAKLTEEFGAPVSDDTVRRLLNKIPDARESRTK